MPSPKLLSRQIVYGVPPGGCPVDIIPAPSHNGLGAGAIVGLIIAILVALLACYIIWRYLQRRHRPNDGDVAGSGTVEPQFQHAQTGFSRYWPAGGKKGKAKSTPGAATNNGGTEMTSIG